MKFLIIFYLLIISTILINCSSKLTTYNENCLSRSSEPSKDLINLYLKLPHRFIRHKNSAKAMCIIENYLNKKQNLLNKISNKNNRPYKWNNKRDAIFDE